MNIFGRCTCRAVQASAPKQTADFPSAPVKRVWLTGILVSHLACCIPVGHACTLSQGGTIWARSSRARIVELSPATNLTSCRAASVCLAGIGAHSRLPPMWGRTSAHNRVQAPCPPRAHHSPLGCQVTAGYSCACRCRAVAREGPVARSRRVQAPSDGVRCERPLTRCVQLLTAANAFAASIEGMKHIVASLLLPVHHLSTGVRVLVHCLVAQLAPSSLAPWALGLVRCRGLK